MRAAVPALGSARQSPHTEVLREIAAQQVGADRRYRVRISIQRVLLLVVWLGSWELASTLGWVDVFLTSSPSRVATKLADWISSGLLFFHLSITVQSAILGFVLGVVAGSVVAAACAFSDRIARVLMPFVTVGNSLPKLAFAPLLVAWFGFGLASKVALPLLLVFFFTFFGVYGGLVNIDKDLLANGRVLGAKRFQLLRHIYLPSAVSWIIASLRLSMAYAFAGAIVAEYVGGSTGIGFLVIYGKGFLNMTEVFTGIIVILLTVGLLDTLLRSIERRFSFWRSA